MADNIAITPGAGATVGTETAMVNAIAVQLQQIKPVLGARDAYTGSQGGRLVDGTTDTAAAFIDPRLSVKNLTANPTVSTTAYVAGYTIGGLLTFTTANRASGAPVLISAVTVYDKSKQNAAIDLILFDTNPTNSTFTDHAALTLLAADLPFVAGIIPIYPGDYSTLATTSAAGKTAVNLEVLVAATSLYGVMVARSTPTYTGTTDVGIKLTCVQD